MFGRKINPINYYFLFQDINELLGKSHDVNELKHVWIQWREATGKKVRSMYTDYVKLYNEAARLNSSVKIWVFKLLKVDRKFQFI